MASREVIERLETGYRMPKPVTNPPCPDSMYELMLHCWHADELQRPTFEYLSVSVKHFFLLDPIIYLIKSAHQLDAIWN